MYHSGTVNVFKRIAQGAPNRPTSTIPFRRRSLVEFGRKQAEVQPVDMLHRKIRSTFRFARSNKRGDARMIKAAQTFNLSQKTTDQWTMAVIQPLDGCFYACLILA